MEDGVVSEPGGEEATLVSEISGSENSSSLTGDEIGEGDQSRIVTARGTEDGLVLRIDGKSEWSDIVSEIESFLGGRKKFFEGGEISLEWMERLPTKEQSSELELFLRENYGIEILSRKRRHPKLRSHSSKASTSEKAASGSAEGEDDSGVTIKLFDEVTSREEAFTQASLLAADGEAADSALHIEMSKEDFALEGEMDAPYFGKMAKYFAEDVLYEEDANAKVVYGTLRSGQKLETPFSLVVIGDVNPGADLIAGGDIIVLGSLRGTAHASAYDDDSVSRVIFALQMKPMQLRIGSVISRGSSDGVDREPEVARIENRRIVVDTFNPRKKLGKR